MIKALRKIGDRDKILSILKKVESKLEELGAGAGGATGTGTRGVKIEQDVGYDPSGAAGAGAEKVVNAIVSTFSKLDREKAMEALGQVISFFEKAGEAAGGATGTGTRG